MADGACARLPSPVDLHLCRMCSVLMDLQAPVLSVWGC